MGDKRSPLYSFLSLLEIVWFSFIYAIRAQRQPRNWVVPALLLPALVGPVRGEGVGTTPWAKRGQGHSLGLAHRWQHLIRHQSHMLIESSLEVPAEAEALLPLVVQMWKLRPREAVRSCS